MNIWGIFSTFVVAFRGVLGDKANVTTVLAANQNISDLQELFPNTSSLQESEYPFFEKTDFSIGRIETSEQGENEVNNLNKPLAQVFSNPDGFSNVPRRLAYTTNDTEWARRKKQKNS